LTTSIRNEFEADSEWQHLAQAAYDNPVPSHTEKGKQRKDAKKKQKAEPIDAAEEGSSMTSQ
ncbi:MAG: hypothetical protein Q9224_006938, partial [Gallowayella concinna]